MDDFNKKLDRLSENIDDLQSIDREIVPPIGWLTYYIEHFDDRGVKKEDLVELKLQLEKVERLVNDCIKNQKIKGV